MIQSNDIQAFVQSRRIAVVGVSRSRMKFGNMVYKELKQHGYEVVPVSASMETYDDQPCYASLSFIPEPVDAAVLIIKPPSVLRVVQDAHAAGIQSIWIQQGCKSDEAVQFCQEKGIRVVYNECVLMFVEPRKWYHQFHYKLWEFLGRLPK
jgi:uncharacterized protein